MQTWKPTIAGILDIVAGAGGIIVWFLLVLGILVFGFFSTSSSFGEVLNWSNAVLLIIVILAIPFVALSILSIVGGVFALRRRIWGLALAGSIGAIFCSTVLGVVAIIFTVLSKDEFEQSSTQ